jgi:hypothetical protein
METNNMSSETMATQLLLACLRMEGGEEEEARLVKASLADWEAAVEQANAQGVTPLVYKRLHDQWPELALPSDIQKRLRNAYRLNLWQNTELFTVLEQILRAFGEEIIPVIPLKGVYLAKKVYENVGLRPMSDVDLLVPRPDLGRAVRVLRGLSFVSDYPFEVEQECQVMHHLPVLYRPRCTWVELHWNLAPLNAPFTIPIEQVWQAARPGTLAGIGIQEMAPEDLLLHLCLHTAYMEHFSSGLRPVCDIAWTIEHYRGKLDWERVAVQAKSWGAERSLYLALRVAQRLLGAALPEGWLESMQPEGYDPSLESWAIHQIFEPAEIRGKLAEVWAPQPWLKRGWRFIRNLFPPVWEMRGAYFELAHGLGWPLAYLKHLGIVFRRNRQAAWRLLRGDAGTMAGAEQRERINRLVAWQAGDQERFNQGLSRNKNGRSSPKRESRATR